MLTSAVPVLLLSIEVSTWGVSVLPSTAYCQVLPTTTVCQVSVLHASSLSQVITHQLLDQWGHEGFFRHIRSVEAFYQHRR